MVKGGEGTQARGAFKAEPGTVTPGSSGPGELSYGPQATWGQDGKREAGQALADLLGFGKGGACREEERNRVGKESIKPAPDPAPGLRAPSWRGLRVTSCKR